MTGRVKVKSKSSLAIVERAYRGSLEEQYGHIVWLSRVMRGMGAETSLLLKGDTVMFARRDQARVDLSIGKLLVRDLSHYESGIADLQRQGVPVYVFQADAERLRLTPTNMVDGVCLVTLTDLPALINRHDCVWYW